MPEYKIRYKDGPVQTLTADKCTTANDFILFDKGGDRIHQVATPEVESVGLAEIPDPEMPQMEVAEVQRSGRGHGFS